MVKTCTTCRKPYEARYSRRKFCSVACKVQFYRTNEEYRTSVSERMKQSLHRGWRTRPRLVMSFAERYWDDVLTQHNLNFVREFRVNKSTLGIPNHGNCLFLDFYFPEIRLDLEIDGSQHCLPDRMEKDKFRDDALISAGYHVMRLPWFGVKSPDQKARTQTQVAKVLDLVK